MKITGNEPAYPTTTEIETPNSVSYQNAFGNWNNHTVKETITHTGLTIRQQFAMAAMQGVLSGIHANENVLSTLIRSADSLKVEPDNHIAQMAVEYADALIEELNKEKP